MITGNFIVLNITIKTKELSYQLKMLGKELQQKPKEFCDTGLEVELLVWTENIKSQCF